MEKLISSFADGKIMPIWRSLKSKRRTNKPHQATEARRGRVRRLYSRDGAATEANYSKILRGNW